VPHAQAPHATDPSAHPNEAAQPTGTSEPARPRGRTRHHDAYEPHATAADARESQHASRPDTPRAQPYEAHNSAASSHADAPHAPRDSTGHDATAHATQLTRTRKMTDRTRRASSTLSDHQHDRKHPTYRPGTGRADHPPTGSAEANQTARAPTRYQPTTPRDLATPSADPPHDPPDSEPSCAPSKGEMRSNQTTHPTSSRWNPNRHCEP